MVQPNPDATGEWPASNPVGQWSLIRNDPAFRLQQKLGLIPRNSLGIRRRVLVFVAAAWLPIIIWSIATGQAWYGGGPETVLGHFVFHVRCLIAIPLLVVAEGIAQQSLPPLLGYFVQSGLVPPERVTGFEALLASVNRLKNQTGPWIIITAVVLAWAIAGIAYAALEDHTWGSAAAAQHITFAGYWVALVVRPLFVALAMIWLWRAILLLLLLHRLVRLPLQLLPTHPDQAAGLAFTKYMVNTFSLVALALASVIAASFAEEMVYQGLTVTQLRLEMLVAVVLITLLFLLPFLPLAIPLAKLKRQGLLQYGVLVSHHHRLVDQRWIGRQQVEDEPILDSPELGPVADVQTIYQAVKQMRLFPFGKGGILLIALPAAVPFLIVCLTQFPLKVVLAKLMGALL
ncbi:hypothetical protein [Silvimonas amylolytica]|uniref:CAAX protease self-immunity n=1 Tax=Silvimonas amylolytica TaxID=449663 RepID=A0ABQ2PPF6_9NEIS|nr:hypothetical protein [Silvimonas amylolytica]GGP27081.1 hypothetical protein GCM10010971_29000 [Silvimonas amylolytica]